MRRKVFSFMLVLIFLSIPVLAADNATYTGDGVKLVSSEGVYSSENTVETDTNGITKEEAYKKYGSD